MSAKEIIKKALAEDWYIQGLNANPLYLLPSAISGFVMKKDLGFGYPRFLFHYQKGYCDMYYSAQALAELWTIIRKKMARNHGYLQSVKRLYEKQYAEFELTYRTMDRILLRRANEADLVSLFKRCYDGQIYSVGSGHIIEPLGLVLEREIKAELRKQFPARKKVNELFSLLTAPSQRSFISQEEHDLSKIAELTGRERAKALAEHQQKYFWLQNSYDGPVDLSVKFFEKRLTPGKRRAAGPISRTKKPLPLRLPRAMRKLIGAIDFATVWQDERKARILKSISYLGRVVAEISRRTKVSSEALNYLAVQEARRFQRLSDLLALERELKTRVRGCFFLEEPASETIVAGPAHDRLRQHQRQSARLRNSHENEIHATTANGGTAIGRVIVCKGLASLAKVKRGDIIVASMTRPEFAPALRKAAAIVTDEGGITCHAAIVARELDIPCVIGAKIATKILRDGTIVEVKANHGVVKIIKR